MDIEVKPFYEGLFRYIAEAHVIELYVSTGRVRRKLSVIDLLRLFKDFEHTLRCSQCALEHVGDVCNFLDWLVESLHILHERLYVANGQSARRCIDGTHNNHQHIPKISCEIS